MPPRKHKTVIVDNGGATLKLGVLGLNASNPRYVEASRATSSLMLVKRHRIISNAIVRSKGDKATYFGPEIEKCVDFSSLHYRLPFEKVSRRVCAGSTPSDWSSFQHGTKHRDTWSTGTPRRRYGTVYLRRSSWV